MVLLDLDFWSFILLIGIGQGVFLSLILLFKKPSHLAFKLLAILLIILTSNLIEFLLLSSTYYKYVPHLTHVSHPFIFLLGPLFYFFIKSHINPQLKFSSISPVHIIPFLLALAYFTPWFFQTAEFKISIYEENLKGTVSGISLKGFLYALTHISVTIGYLVFSFLQVKKLDPANKGQKILLQFNTVFIGYWFIQLIGLITITIFQYYVLTIDFVLALINAVFIQVLSFQFLLQLNFLSGFSLQARYQQSSLSAKTQAELLLRIQELVNGQEVYLDSELTLQKFSESLSVNKNYISQVINEEFHCSFNEYINGFRIKKAKMLLSNQRYNWMKLLAVALESGFNNKTSFNRVFTKMTGQNPSEFRKLRIAETEKTGYNSQVVP